MVGPSSFLSRSIKIQSPKFGEKTQGKAMLGILDKTAPRATFIIPWLLSFFVILLNFF